MIDYWVIERPDGKISVHKDLDNISGAVRRAIWRRASPDVLKLVTRMAANETVKAARRKAS